MEQSPAGPPTVGSVLFEAKNPGKLPVPPLLGCFMVCIFTLPAVMVVATTIKEVPKSPWLILVYLAACFPLVVLYVLKRLMTRYALRVYPDGMVEVVFPFKTVRIKKDELASVNVRSDYVAAIKARQTWVNLFSPEGKALATFSPTAFPDGSMDGFLNTLRCVHPAVVIQK